VSTEDAGADGKETGERTAGEAPAECTVSLYLRGSPTAVGKRRQEDIERRVSELLEEGRVEAVDIERWPGKVRVGAQEESPVADAFDDLAGAADEAGARLAPFFSDRQGVDGMLQSHADTRIITFPVVTLVVEREADIVGLYPCRRDGVHYRVETAVDALAAGDLPDNLR
jgi:hypothetical protein